MIICNNQILNKLGSFFPKKALDFRKVDRILFYSIKCQRFRIWISFINSINQKSHAFQKEHKSFFFFFLKQKEIMTCIFLNRKKKPMLSAMLFSVHILLHLIIYLIFFAVSLDTLFSVKRERCQIQHILCRFLSILKRH